ncbi:MAG: AAA family ATPase [Proteobacteria bacterium]|nr:AAA family ATPase [Pseudomonadota bacterium]
MNIPPATRIYAVASGKGGVGKTSLTLNLATLLTRQKKRVLVFDGDTGLANLDVQLGMKPERDLAHYIAGQFALKHVISKTPQGFDLLAGRAGHQALVNLTLPRLTQLMNDLRALSENYDVILLDIAAGVAPQALFLCTQAHATLLITTPDPSSLTDAYALVKLMWQDNATANAQLIVNQASKAEAAQVHTRLTTAMEKFLHLPPLPYLGNIPHDRLYATAVKSHLLAVTAFPNCPAVTALDAISRNLP